MYLRHEELIPPQLDIHIRWSIVDERFEPVLEQQHAVLNPEENPHLHVLQSWRRREFDRTFERPEAG